MAGFNPSQVDFSGGEVSPRIAGRVDSDLYRKALASCINARPTPHGSWLMRAGTGFVARESATRLIPFNVSSGEPYVLEVSDTSTVVRNHLGVTQAIYANMVSNGTFDAVISPWSAGSGFSWSVGGFVRATVTASKTWSDSTVNWTSGVSYTVKLRARGDGTLRVYSGSPPANYGLDSTITLTAQWSNYSYTFTATGTAPAGGFRVIYFEATGVGTYWDIDDVMVVDNSFFPADHLATPWTVDQISSLQFDQDLTKSRMMVVHGNVRPELVTLNVHGLWETRAAPLSGTPTSWVGTNWPTIIEWGFQGRLWLGAAPDSPNVFNGSKSGDPFNFTLGSLASDGLEFSASVRGPLRWMQGQKSLLMGSERVEQAAHGGGSIITPSNIQVEDESAFGSAAIQAVHLGDEVVFVGRSRREIRTLSFDALNKNGWVSTAISFIAEHLTRSVREVHFGRSPDPTILALNEDDSFVCGIYDRARGISAWSRIDVGAPVLTAAVVETTNGSEAWLCVDRAGGPTIEILPLHEVGIGYLDCSVQGTVPVGGVITGLSHLTGQTVRVVVDGTLLDDQAVVAGHVTVDAALEGKAYVVGLPYTATAVTLKLEGGLGTGSSQTAKRRINRVRLRLNDSAIPLVNGKRAPERAPADPMDTGTDRITGDVDVNLLGWDDGVLTITQDLPFRTEVLAIFGNAQVNEV